jgi:hypothetical protein
MDAKTYWNGTGRYQEQADLLETLIPASGPVYDAEGANKHLDAFRRAVNCYYDLYNNGLFNRAREFKALFKMSGSADPERVEDKMTQFILAAMQEQFGNNEEQTGESFAYHGA